MRLSRNPRKILLVAAAAAGGFGCTAQTVAERPATDAGREWVAVGDSILHGRQSALRGELGDDGVLDAEIGRGVSAGLYGQGPGSLAAAEQLVPTVEPGGWVWIQEDGGSETVESYAEFVDDVADMADDRCVGAVLPITTTEPDRSAQFRQVIRARLAAHPCSAVADWASAVENDPSLLADDRHPSDAGGAVLADLIGDASS